MDDAERRERGTHMRRQILGDAHVDRAAAQASELTADFQDLLNRYAWGEIWTRPGLDRRTRRMLVIASTVALGRWDEFKLHVRAALASGDVTQGEIKEILLQQAIYCGVPAAHAAFAAMREVVDA